VPGHRFPAGLAALVAAVALVLAGCSSKPAAPAALPSASPLLQASSQAMAAVRSAHFTLAVTGPALTSIPLARASGEIARNGDGQATAEVTELGQLLSFQVVMTGGSIYIKGPTGGYTSEPASDFYNPALLLDPSQGLAGLLAQATDGRTLDAETVESTPAYRLTAIVPTTILAGLTKLAAGQATVTATLWVARSGDRLLQVRVPFRVPGAKDDTTVTASLSEFNLPVSVQTPTT
jgi:lipoprotein LprG